MLHSAHRGSVTPAAEPPWRACVQTLNQLLTEIDGFTPSTGVVFIAATNRPGLLDPALVRAGRFDRTVTVPRPDAAARRRHSKGARVALVLFDNLRMGANGTLTVPSPARRSRPLTHLTIHWWLCCRFVACT